jgi:hypothetical protein
MTQPNSQEFDAIVAELQKVDASLKTIKEGVDKNLKWAEPYMKKEDPSGIQKYTDPAKKSIEDARKQLEGSGKQNFNN